ncbi:hypothetical protein QQ008_03360 [Fulvivirgaceae bacterium BMA10]|uniref:Uncharacterized protein n=1 Tax=Splendidivirga corallicola TaxID=3051826 RepID=A0ABT8KI38_9BACT|nr:hypothetical protein [Fulvivirgaceae bacterium BMA10]
MKLKSFSLSRLREFLFSRKKNGPATNLKRRDVIKALGVSLVIVDPLTQTIVKAAHKIDVDTFGDLLADDLIAVDLLRPDDLLKLRIVFHNCKFQKKEQTTFVVKKKPKKAGFMVVNLPSQHTLEEAYSENASNIKLPAKFIRAGSSRLVYELPMEFEGIPLTMEKLLDWSGYTLKVNYRARAIEPLIMKLVTPFTKKSKTILKGSKILQNYIPNESKELANRRLNLSPNPKYKLQQTTLYDQDRIRRITPSDNLQQADPKVTRAVNRKALLKVATAGKLETSIEAPARLFISPNQLNDFVHTKGIKPKLVAYSYPKGDINKLGKSNNLDAQEGNVVELWHTRMGVKLKNGQVSEQGFDGYRTIRALWSTDHNQKNIDHPFKASLDSRDRYFLVHETSDFNIKGYTPRPVQAKKLMLTALGAWIDFYGNFDYPDRVGKGLDLLQWEHRSTLGRDHYVKVVEAGFLYPFGHKASLVKITERKFDKSKTAVNRKRMFVVVMEPEKLYAARDNQNNFVPFPFQSVKINTSRTPNLDDPQNLKNLGANYNFWLMVGGQPFLFNIENTDKEGQTTQMQIPMIFVSETAAFDTSKMQQINGLYNFEAQKTSASASGQVIAYAESLVPGDTNLITENMRFGAIKFNSGKQNRVKFHPTMASAQVQVKVIEELTGDKSPVAVRLYDDENDAGVFIEVIANKMLDFNGGTDKAGGIMNPNTSIRALSKLQGAVGGEIDKMANLDFDPEAFFNENASLGGAAKLFGVIPIFELLFGNINITNESADLTNTLNGFKGELEDIQAQIQAKKEALEDAADAAKAELQQAINQLTGELNDIRNQLQDTLDNHVPKIPGLKMYKTDQAVVVEYKWLPELEKEKDLFNILKFKVNGDPKNAMQIGSKLVRPFDPDQGTQMSVESRLDDFSVEIANIIGVNFEFIRFGSGSGKKADVKVKLDQQEAIIFLGPLAFVNNLQNIIPGDGFAEGPYINLQPTGIKAGYELGIPSVEVGMLSIANITLGAYVRLPFTGAPLTIGFNFCRRENPFLLTISCFGGGGFFALESSIKGLVMVEAAFEFGAALSFDIGVASGGVSVMGGFYFKMEVVEEDHTVTQLTGYIRLNGSLSILGLITLAIEFYLALTYLIESGKAGKLYGEATVKVKVEILFFSKSVSMTVRRTLKGADADPTFAQMIEESDWLAYCEAFAS